MQNLRGWCTAYHQCQALNALHYLISQTTSVWCFLLAAAGLLFVPHNPLACFRGNSLFGVEPHFLYGDMDTPHSRSLGSPQSIKLRPDNSGLVIGTEEETKYHNSVMADLEEELESELTTFATGGRLMYTGGPKRPLSGLSSPLTVTSSRSSPNSSRGSKTEAPKKQRRFSKTYNAGVTICGAGNAAHVFIPYFTDLGYEVSVFAGFKDEAARLKAAYEANGGIEIADGCDPQKLRTYKYSPVVCSNNAADSIPNADYVIIALPSFAVKGVLLDIKPHLKQGAIIFIMPGQGGVDFIVKEVLGEECRSGKVSVAGIIPMPLNCRIEEFGKKVQLKAFKASYDLAAIPARDAPKCAFALSELLAGRPVHPIGNYVGIALHASNPNIHPGRLYGLFGDYKPGKIYPENPLFYETWNDKSSEWCQKISDERVKIWKTICEKVPGTGEPNQVPGLKQYIESIYAGQIHNTSSLSTVFNTNDGFKGFFSPMKKEGDGWVPDFQSRYFTEDFPEGFCMYKGIADLAGVETPTIDLILTHFQNLMGKEYIKNGKLAGKDVGETKSPQRFGIKSLSDLLRDGLPAEQVPKTEAPKRQRRFSKSYNAGVTICGAGNAAHVFIPYFTDLGYEVSVFAGFKDEAARLKAAYEANGGIEIADGCDPQNPRTYKHSPVVCSNNAADSIPNADYVIIALPSFAVKGVLLDIKPHLKQGAIIYIMPGQGGVDFIVKEVLGEECRSGKVSVAGIIPMPLNCRIEEFGKKVQLKAFKASYDLAAIPARDAPKCAFALSELLAGRPVHPIGNYVGIALHASNPNIHPGRLYGLFGDYKPGKIYPENPLFYETWNDKSSEWCQKISDERVKIWKTICEKVPGTGEPNQVPGLKQYIESIYAGQIHNTSSLSTVFNTNDGFKGFFSPMKKEGDGWVPDFQSRYFTEDFPEGFCMYKGIADLAGVETPTIDLILTHFQNLMGKEYIKNGKLAGKDVGETKSPQRFGIKSLSDLLRDGLPAEQVPKTEAPKRQRRFSKSYNAGVTICGAGNAAHVFIPYFTDLGYEVSVFAGFKDEAARLKAAYEANGGIEIADGCDPQNPRTYKHSPVVCSNNAADSIPNADYVIIALPSFAVKGVLLDIKPHLKQGAIIYIMPGQGGVDFIVKEVLGEECRSGKVSVAGIIPMPLNCRIEEFGKKVQLKAFKASYDLAAIPARDAPKCAFALSELLAGRPVHPIGNYVGIALHASNPNIHPGRLYGLFGDYKPGKIYPENPLFYETWNDKSSEWCQKISDERVKIWKTICEKVPGTGEPNQVPGLKQYIESIYAGQIHNTSSLSTVFNTNDGFKGFFSPMKKEGDGWVPDFQSRYFTEDFPEGFCMYKGIADLAGVETPTIDLILTHFQNLMGKEYIKNGKLAGKDVGETKSPQRFGIKSLSDLLRDGLPAEQVPKTEAPKRQRRFSKSYNASVTICGAGNAAHVFIPYFTDLGYEVSVFAGFKDEAARLKAAYEANGGIEIADGCDPQNPRTYKHSPVVCSNNAADSIPNADYVIIALPSFAVKGVLLDIKPHLKQGAIIYIMPGQGGVDFIVKEVLGEECRSGKVSVAGIIPMPLNCRIEEFGKKVQLKAFKASYDLAAIPARDAPKCAFALSELLAGRPVHPIGNYVGIALHASNPNIHPGRLYGLFGDYKPGKIYPENPLFYETWNDKSSEWCQKISDERVKIWKTICEKVPGTGEPNQVPGLKQYIESIYAGQIHNTSSLSTVFNTNDGFKGFFSPMKKEGDGWVPDFQSRYFTEDFPEGFCMYKGIADLAGVETPTIDLILTHFQNLMGKEYIKNGKLAGKDVGETKSPQRFGIKSLSDLLRDGLPAEQVPKTEAPKRQRRFSKSYNASVTICGAGNAAHVFIPYFTDLGYEVSVFAGFKDEAARLKAAYEANGGIEIADGCDPQNPRTYKHSPVVCSNNAADSIPNADYVIIALPSFAVKGVLLDIKPHLKQGAIIYIMPGQGGVDFIVKEVLGEECRSGKVSVAGIIPMPLNCRIEEFGKKVQLKAFKASYDLAAIPARDAPKCAFALSELLAGRPVHPIGNYVGIALHASNPNIHPGRLYGLFGDYKPGKIYPENPLFYETWNDKSSEWCQKISDERVKIWKTICEKVPGTGEPNQVPGLKQYIESIYAGQIHNTSSLSTVFNTNDGFKGFFSPMKKEGDGWVPDFQSRYFTEDFPEGFCMYKGIADLAGVETPTIDLILTHFQNLMGKEYIKNGKLAGKDVGETKSPQRFGIKSLSDLLRDGLPAEQIPKTEAPKRQRRFSKSYNAGVTICGAGNAAHVFIPYFTDLGYEVSVFAGFKDEAARLKAAYEANGGIEIADGCDPQNPRTYKHSPVVCSNNAADSIPNADYVIIALPSFAVKGVLLDIKPHLKQGAIIYIMPGQGGVDFIVKEVLGEECRSGKVSVAGIIPMPLNCRIEEFGKKVQLKAFKASYDLAAIPARDAPKCAFALSELLAGRPVHPIGNYVGIALHASNPNIHPGRLYGLFGDYKPGKVYSENPLFYETWDDKSSEWCQKISDERVKIWKTICEKVPGTGEPNQVPGLKQYIESIYAGQIHNTSSLSTVFNTNDGFKGFFSPMKKEGNNWVPDFQSRYFTEDFPEGFCMYKGIADLAGVETPTIDLILTHFQNLMGKEYIKNGKLAGKDVGETKSPQRFGLHSLEQLLKD